MAPPKANEFLDASDSEEEQINGYESEDDVKKGGRGVKRRKISSEDEDDAGASDNEQDSVDGRDDNDDDAEEDSDANDEEEKSKKSKSSKADLPEVDRPLTKKNLVATEAAIKKSGVLYISRIPPFMKPNKLRSLLAPYGTINRIFLAPEDPTGWIEFTDKKRAKSVSELLNARPIGGKKGSYYRDDIWNLLYLKGFKWHNLTEQIAAEDAERSSRMRAEISKSTRENKLFVRNIERAKMLDGMEAKAKAKKRKASEAVEKKSDEPKESARTFRQIAHVKKDHDTSEQPEHVTRVLSKIF
ncbi:Pre-rRNA-processing protein ESF2 [Cladobotryum mycophilum]|uniref:18S rRNA factor 2 n=1 Tax=Cladobotryum mycophilum TaxID=491253 RepID=A0ABR0T291_9HYPO